jgi:tRNA A37 threonylcarbamoyladenosine modification protein TsaB
MHLLKRSSGRPPARAARRRGRRSRAKPDATGSLIATWVDAWRGEIYAALYENGHEIEAPVVARPEDVLADLRRRIPDPGPRIPDPGSRTPDPITFIGDGAASYRDLILDTLGDGARIADPPSPLLAGVVALIASACTEWHPPHAIRPLYVRRPDAELARQHRTG